MTEVKRNKRFIRAWIKALRSGKYEQGIGMLHRTRPDSEDPAGYCCLGVACRISSKIKSVGVDNDNAEGFVFPSAEGRGIYKGASYASYATLSDDMLDYIGITAEEEALLVEMNDEGLPFPEIADKLEEWIK